MVNVTAVLSWSQNYFIWLNTWNPERTTEKTVQ